MSDYTNAFLALKKGTEIFCCHTTLDLKFHRPFGLGIITGKKPTLLVRGVYYSCYKPETIILISLRSLIITFVNENPGRFYNLSGLTEEFRVLYRRKANNFVDISVSRDKLSLVDITIQPPGHLALIRVTSLETKVFSVDDWDNWFVNIAALDIGLESVKKPWKNR